MKGSELIESCYAFFAALIGRWIAAETYAWMPAIADWLLRIYVRFLPQEMGERLLEEWRSLLYDTPGNIAKLATAVDLGRTIFFIGKETRELDDPRRVSSLDKNENEITYPYAKHLPDADDIKSVRDAWRFTTLVISIFLKSENHIRQLRREEVELKKKQAKLEREYAELVEKRRRRERKS